VATTAQALSQAVLDGLAAQFGGEIVVPSGSGYDEHRTVFNSMVDRRPALIARCGSEADVVTALRFARANDLEVAVKGGGHSVAGHAICDGGIVIDLSPMKAIVVDPEARTAVAQAGLTWTEFDRATQQHGLALTGGRVGSTGISGLTLGSGSGWLERRFGLTSDSLLAARVVVADGRALAVSEEEHADLFWGIRGGGGNFGIVTEFTFRLHQVGPVITAGLMIYPRERAAEVLRHYRSFIESAPDEVGGAFAFVTAPPDPALPDHLRGQPAAGILYCHCGSLEEGERHAAKLRELPADVDLVQPMPYTVLQTMIDGPNQPGHRNYWKAENLRHLDDAAIDAFVAQAAGMRSPFTQLIILPVGGAIGATDDDATALSGRHAPWQYHALALWDDPADDDANIAWARGLADALAAHVEPGVFLNFTSDQGESRVRSAFGDKYDRLVAIKDSYDPDNVFHHNQNIKPSRG
jgi:FAD/FMN-containing dehydrogenase